MCTMFAMRSRRLRLCYVAVLVVAVLYTARSAAAADATLGEFVLEGMQNQRECLRSGAFRARGTKTVVSTDGGRPSMDEVRVSAAFDVDKELWRFDWDGPRPVNWISPYRRDGGPGEPQHVDRLSTKFIRAADHSAHYFNEYRRVEIHPVDATVVESLGRVRQFFDVRCLGLYYWGDLRAGKRYEQLIGAVVRRPPDDCVEDEPGLFRLQWVGRNEELKSNRWKTLWIDENKGYSPIRLTLNWETDGKAFDPDYVHEASWELVNEVWVPQSFRMSHSEWTSAGSGEPGAALPRVDTTLAMAIDWETVNTSIDATRFDYADFGCPAGTCITDYRSGKAVSLGTVGAPLPKFEGAPPSAWSVARVVCLAGGVMLLVAVTAALKVWKRSRGIAETADDSGMGGRADR